MMDLMRSTRKRAAVSIWLLSLALMGCGTFEVGIAATPGTATPMSALETRAVTPAAPETTDDSPAVALTQPPKVQTPALSSPSSLRVAFAKESNVWLWVEGEDAVQLTRRGGVEQIELSDDGAIVAFTRGGELWMVRADGTDEIPLVSIDDLEAIRMAMSKEEEILLNRFAWIPGTHVVAFNTRLDAEIGLLLNDDLRTVDADSGEQSLLLVAGDGGEFYYSPDGRAVAVVTSGSISLLDAGGGNRLDLFTYTPVATASEFRYYAVPVWSADSTFLRVVIPPANPFTNPPQPSTVWHLPADGPSASLLGDIEMAGPSISSFSPDLRFIAHLVGLPSGPAHGTSLAVSDLDLRGTITYYPSTELATRVTLASGDVITYHATASEIFGWSPDGKRLAFGANTHPELPYQAQIGEMGGAVEPAAPGAEGAVIDLSWVDATRYLFVAQGARGWDVVLGSVDGAPTTVGTVGGTGAPPSYDFAAPEADPSEPATSGPSDQDLPQGLVFQTPDGLWLVDGAGEPQLVSEQGNGVLASDSSRMLYEEDDDIWVVDLAGGEPRNVTSTPDRYECCPQWWPGHTETILFGSKAPEQDGPNYGFPTVTRLDLPDYRILDDSEVMYSLPAPSPDGRTVAYDRAGKAWQHVTGSGQEPFDPTVFGLPIAYGSPGDLQWRVVSPSWSPDGGKLAWIVADCREGECGTSVGLFDLVGQTAQLLHPYIPVGRGGQPLAALWSPDGQWLAFSAWAENPDQAGLWVMRADGQEEHALVTGVVRSDPTPVWSPDGRSLAFSAPSADGSSQTFWLAVTGRWDRTGLDLPPDARLVGWVSSDG